MDVLNGCGLALSQGDGSDLQPRCNWEAIPPSYRACMRAWRRLAPCHGATPSQTYYGSPVKVEEKGMLAGVTDCRRSQKWGYRGRLVLGFKPRHGSHTWERPTQFWRSRGREPHCFGRVGPHGPDTADGAGSLNHGLLLLFLRYSTHPGQREKDGLCASVSILKDFSILMKTLSHYSKSV